MKQIKIVRQFIYNITLPRVCVLSLLLQLKERFIKCYLLIITPFLVTRLSATLTQYSYCQSHKTDNVIRLIVFNIFDYHFPYVIACNDNVRVWFCRVLHNALAVVLAAVRGGAGRIFIGLVTANKCNFATKSNQSTHPTTVTIIYSCVHILIYLELIIYNHRGGKNNIIVSFVDN